MNEHLRPDDAAPVYAISVAAQLAGLHPQTLRQYDRLGLVSPGRTGGRNRLYSLRDIASLREVSRLSAEGVNLAGIQRRSIDQHGKRRLRRDLAGIKRNLPLHHRRIRLPQARGEQEDRLPGRGGSRLIDHRAVRMSRP